MKNYGNTQRRYGTDMPRTFDRETLKVCLDIQSEELDSQSVDGETVSGSADTDTTDSTEQPTTATPTTVQGYSWVEVYLGEGGLDYPTVKSKLIEAAYAPKDEFGHLMNAMSALINGDTTSEDIEAFKTLDTWRAICAKTAKEICQEVGTI